jgi:hypothetical protein
MDISVLGLLHDDTCSPRATSYELRATEAGYTFHAIDFEIQEDQSPPGNVIYGTLHRDMPSPSIVGLPLGEPFATDQGSQRSIWPLGGIERLLRSLTDFPTEKTKFYLIFKVTQTVERTGTGHRPAAGGLAD